MGILDVCTLDFTTFDPHFVGLSVPGSNTAPDGGFSSMMLMMLGWLVVATCLYLLRPNSLRNRGDMKPSRNNVRNSLFYSDCHVLKCPLYTLIHCTKILKPALTGVIL